jgi:hypothetical protein
MYAEIPPSSVYDNETEPFVEAISTIGPVHVVNGLRSVEFDLVPNSWACQSPMKPREVLDAEEKVVSLA